jgi:hypothetical protein
MFPGPEGRTPENGGPKGHVQPRAGPKVDCGTGRSEAQWAGGKGWALALRDTECVSYRADES